MLGGTLDIDSAVVRGRHGLRWRKIAAIVTIAVGVPGGCALAALRHGFGGLVARPWERERSTVEDSETWEDILAHPRPIRVESMVTGEVLGDRCVVLDRSDPALDRVGPCVGSAVVVAHVVHHQSKGSFLIDAGLASSFSDGGGNYTVLLSMLLWSLGAEVKQSTVESASSQLAARDVSLRAVFVTHLHADHTSGLVDLDDSIPIVFGSDEDTFAQRALMGDHLVDRPLRTLDFQNAPPRGPFAAAIDVLGDGSLWALSTPGHSPGHTSYLVNGPQPVLITGDAAAYQAQLAHRIRPSPDIHDVEAAVRSLETLARFAERFPAVEVRVGHEVEL